MIWHFFEVWVLILGTFIIGCGLGAAFYTGIGNSRLATAQGTVADAVGDVLDGIKSRLGLHPEWREGFRVPVERPLPKPKARKRREEPRYEDEYEDDDYPEERAPARSLDDYREEEEWSEDDNWREDGRADDGAYYEEDRRTPPDDSVEDVPAVALPKAGPEEEITPQRPAGLLAPRNGVPDHLQRIRGIGKGNEELLNSFGIYHFGQIAAWTPAEVRWVAAHLPFPERIERDDWVGQAIILASGGDTGYVKSAERRRARRAGGDNPEEDEGEGTAK
jgi:predicted flap endonuclease-1-like 5' DNA nuclease